MSRRGRSSYTEMLDEETWAFVERTETFCPPDSVGLSIAEQRKLYDRMCRAFRHGCSDDLVSKNLTIDAGSHGIPVRCYRRRRNGMARARIVYFHGGGFMVGGLESHDDVCAEICARTRCHVVSVDYRLAPEHRHPAAFEDALDGFDWASRIDDLPLILAGDSAGGNLAAAVAYARRNQPHSASGQVLIYPDLGGDRTKGSYVAHANAPMLTLHEIESYRAIRAGEWRDKLDPGLCPLASTDFEGLPPSVVVTAQCDPLSSDGESYCRRIREAGGKALWIEEKGLVHGYLRARHSVGRAAESFTRIIEAFDALADRRWPYAGAEG